MGKVYEFEAIQEGRIPTANDFSNAKQLVLTGLAALVNSDEVYGAKIFGSVAKGSPNERSDFDIVVITEKDSSLMALRKLFLDVRDTSNVDIEPIVIGKVFAALGFHSIENLFLDHICSIPNNGNMVGLDPLNVLVPSSLDAKTAYKQYLASKLRRLKEGLFTYSELDRNRVLQRSLEAPVNVGRRLLQVLSYLGNEDGKQEVVQEFREKFRSTTVIPGFEFLLEQDNRYTAYLRQAVRGEVTPQDYEEHLHLMADECIEAAIGWSSEVSLYYNSCII